MGIQRGREDIIIDLPNQVTTCRRNEKKNPPTHLHTFQLTDNSRQRYSGRTRAMAGGLE